LTEEDIVTLPCFQVSLSLSGNSLKFLPCLSTPKLTFWLLLSFSQNQTLIAIKAPQASYIEVPDPDEVGNMDGWGSKNYAM
jgi:hypothetical protein